jgi:hypothetical protein
MPGRNHLRRVNLWLVLFAALLTTSCAATLFKVKPAIDLPPLAGNIKTANAGGVTIRVAPLMTDEESQDLFEANLPLSGVLALRLELVFESGVPVETKRVRFRLRDGAGREWKVAPAKAAIARVLKANGVFAYNPNARKQFEKEFGAYAIELKEPLSTSDRNRQGFIFFLAPRNEAVESPQGLTLSVEGLPQKLEIAIN